MSLCFGDGRSPWVTHRRGRRQGLLPSPGSPVPGPGRRLCAGKGALRLRLPPERRYSCASRRLPGPQPPPTATPSPRPPSPAESATSGAAPAPGRGNPQRLPRAAPPSPGRPRDLLSPRPPPPARGAVSLAVPLTGAPGTHPASPLSRVSAQVFPVQLQLCLQNKQRQGYSGKTTAACCLRHSIISSCQSGEHKPSHIQTDSFQSKPDKYITDVPAIFFKTFPSTKPTKPT